MKYFKLFESFLNEAAVNEKASDLDMSAMAPVTRDVLKSGDFERITAKTKLKVGDNLLGMFNGVFFQIKSINGDTIKIVDDAWGDTMQRSRKKIEDSFLVDVRKSKK